MSESNLLEAARRFVALWDHPAREPGVGAWHVDVDNTFQELKKAVAACASDASHEQEATDQTARDLDEAATMLAKYAKDLVAAHHKQQEHIADLHIALTPLAERFPGLGSFEATVQAALAELQRLEAGKWDQARVDEATARIQAAVAEGRLLSKDSVEFLEEMVRQKAAKERPEVLDGESVKLKFPTIKSSASMEVTYRWRPDGETVTKTVVLENNPGLVHAITVDFTPRTEGDKT